MVARRGVRRAALLAVVLGLGAGCVNIPDWTFANDEVDQGAAPPRPSDAGGEPEPEPGADAGMVDQGQPDASGICVREDEVCNGVDDDCDLLVDEDFPLATDIDNCGDCGRACRPPRAVPMCVGGACAVESCEPGYADLDGEALNGCEYTCPVEPTAEDCNGIDDDCDGVTDEELDGSVIDEFGVCADAQRPCNGADGWGPPDLAALPDYQAEESLCDGLDNDCDGRSDEGQAVLGQLCTVGVGACVADGTRICAPDRRGTVCDAEPSEPAADDARCDGIDSDCDGRIDEDAPGCVQCDGGAAPPCNGCPEGISVPAGWVCAPAGEFFRGSPADEAERYEREGPRHRVRLTHPFLVQSTEVTQRQWSALLATDPAFFSGQPRRPVERITWYEAVAYTNALSEAEGLTPCYALEGCNGEPAGEGLVCQSTDFVGLDCDGYRLPTEAEWAYAARAGTITRFWFGDDEDRLGQTDWYAGNANDRTHDVGQLAPNPWGLYDVHGNVWEWVHDGFTGYVDQILTDPTGDDEAAQKARRGGSFGALPRDCRSAYREDEPPIADAARGGFRPVRTVSPR